VLGYLISRKKIREIFKTHLTNKGIYVLRIPGFLGFSFSNLLVKNNIKYIAEVVGDPYEVIKNLKIWKPLRYLMMWKSKFQMKKSVFNASGVLYVTKYQLQNKYPKSKSAFTAAASNVIIKDEDVVLRDKVKVLTSLKERLCNKSLEPIRIGVLGMLYPIKSPLEIVEAVDLLIKEGINIELIFA